MPSGSFLMQQTEMIARLKTICRENITSYNFLLLRDIALFQDRFFLLVFVLPDKNWFHHDGRGLG
jgi:hypothetical protein